MPAHLGGASVFEARQSPKALVDSVDIGTSPRVSRTCPKSPASTSLPEPPALQHHRHRSRARTLFDFSHPIVEDATLPVITQTEGATFVQKTWGARCRH
ncbi:uncharacterized protein LOC119160779 isoform X2 [Rhipicephalus microplus]|uniref:uncharacterized protein LOC119160779 isoform X2 n=1 Tax=Rhipicephalus microplus TaxID=6941 RepID=UPI003F6BCE21